MLLSLTQGSFGCQAFEKMHSTYGIKERYRGMFMDYLDRILLVTTRNDQLKKVH